MTTLNIIHDGLSCYDAEDECSKNDEENGKDQEAIIFKWSFFTGNVSSDNQLQKAVTYDERREKMLTDGSQLSVDGKSQVLIHLMTGNKSDRHSVFRIYRKGSLMLAASNDPKTIYRTIITVCWQDKTYVLLMLIINITMIRYDIFMCNQTN